MPEGGGRTLGIARAFIELSTERFQQARQVIQRGARQIKRDIASIGTEADTTSNVFVGAFSRMQGAFSTIGKSLANLKGSFAQLGPVAKTITGFKAAFAGAREVISSVKEDVIRLKNAFLQLPAVANSISAVNTAFKVTKKVVQDAKEAAVILKNKMLEIPAVVNGLSKVNGVLTRMKGHFSDIGRSLASLKDGFLKLSTVASGIVLFGAREAQDTKRVQVTLRAITGSAEEVAKITKTVRNLSNEFGTPYQDLLEGAAGFVPIAKQTGLQLETLLLSAQKLVALNPAQDFDAAKFSLREALGGDFVSIRDRFDLSKSDTTFLKGAGEDADEFIRRLDEILAKKGITEDTLKEIGTSGINAFAQLKSSVGEALSTAFTPLLNNVLIPLAEGFRDFFNQINQTNPQLLTLIGSVVALVAAGGPLVLLLGQIKTAMTALKAAAAGGIGKGLGKAALGVAAVGVGAQIGKTIGQGLADSGIGDQRLRSDSGEDFFSVIGERLKQLVVIVASVFLDFVKVIADGATTVGAVLDYLAAIFRFLGSFVSELFGTFEKAIGDFVLGIGHLLENVLDTTKVKEVGLSLQTSGLNRQLEARQGRDDALDRIRQGLIPPGTYDQVNANFEQLRKTVIGGLTDMLFPAQEVADQLEDTADRANAAVQNIPTGPEFNDDQITAFMDFQDELKQIEADAQADRESALADHEDRKADIIDRAAEQIEKIRSDQALKEQRDQKKLDDEIAKSRAKADDDIKKLTQKNTADIIKAENQAKKEVDDARAKALDDEAEQIKAHEDKLAEIRQKARQSVLEGARQLDARAVYAAQQRQQQEIAQEEQAHQEKLSAIDTTLTEQTQAVATKLREQTDEMRTQLTEQTAEIRTQLDAQIAERKAALEEQHRIQREDDALRIQEIVANRDKELEAQATALEARLAQIDDQAKKEAEAREKAFIDEFNRLATHEQTKIQIQRDGQAQAEKELLGWWKRVTSEVAKTGQQATQQATPEQQQAFNQFKQGAQNTLSKVGAGISNIASAFKNAFNLGGSGSGGGGGFKLFHSGARKVGQTGNYRLEEGESVLSRNTANALRRAVGGDLSSANMLRLAQGGGGGGVQIAQVGPFSFGDIGNYSPQQIMDMVRNVLDDELPGRTSDFLGGFR